MSRYIEQVSDDLKDYFKNTQYKVRAIGLNSDKLENLNSFSVICYEVINGNEYWSVYENYDADTKDMITSGIHMLDHVSAWKRFYRNISGESMNIN